ncbi:MAG: hypothetical protein ACTS6G_03335 [Candidatus Hodgkinia cicadicola]
MRRSSSWPEGFPSGLGLISELLRKAPPNRGPVINERFQMETWFGSGGCHQSG